MKNLMKKKHGKGFAGTAIMLLLACYLIATGAMAQPGTTNSAVLSEGQYSKDPLSYGDIWAFDETTHGRTNYNTGNTALEWYTTEKATSDTSDKNKDSYTSNYFVTVDTSSGVLDKSKSTILSQLVFAKFRSNVNTASSQGSVPVVTLADMANTGLYSVVPNGKGTYYVHLYVDGASEDTVDMRYALLDSGESTNAYAVGFSAEDTITMKRIGTTNWYRGEVNVEVVTWSSVELTNTPGSVNSNTNNEAANTTHKGGGIFSGTTREDVLITNLKLSGTDYYYNEWSKEDIYYNTVLVLEIPAGTALGPISSEGELVLKGAGAGGIMKAESPFGEVLAEVSSVESVTVDNIPNMPVSLTVTLDEGYEFKEFQNAVGAKIGENDAASAENTANLMQQTDGFDSAEDLSASYIFYLESAQDSSNNNAPVPETVQAIWQSGEVLLPTISVTGNDNTFDFVEAITGEGTFTRVGGESFTFTLNADGAEDFVSASYTVSGEIYNGKNSYDGTVNGETLSFTVTPVFDETKVIIRATDTGGVNHVFTYTLTPVENSAAEMIIENTTQGISYPFIEDALMAASSGDILVPLKEKLSFVSAEDYDGVMSLKWAENKAGYTIKSGVTLLVPYSASDTTIDTTTATDESGGFASTLIHANVTFVTQDSEGNNGGTVTGIMEPNTSVTYTLTIPSGAALNINDGGKLVVGGTVVAGTNSTTGICGATAGAHSNIQLDGTLNVNSGGILSTCGYILGGGTVNVFNNGTVYQPFVFMDHKDGHYLYAAKDENYFALNRHSMMNIRTKIVLNTGADMYGYVTFFTKKNSFASAQFNVTSIHVVGSGGEEALFLLGGTLTMTYDPSKTLSVTSSTDNNNKGYYSKVGRTIMEFDGDASLGYISLNLKVAGSSYSMSSAASVFPLSYNYNIIQKSGTFTVANHLSLLPGVTFTVNSGAAMTLNSGKTLVIYDGLRDYAQRSESVTLDGDDGTGGTWPRYHYPSSANLKSAGFSSTAELIMNGTLTVNGNLGGTVQSDGITGKIIMGSSAGTSATTQFGAKYKTTNLVVTTIAGSCGKTVRTLPAQVFTAKSTGPVQLAAGKNYVISRSGTNTINSYTYSVYAAHDTDTATSETKNDLNATVKGIWKCETCTAGAAVQENVKAATCTAGGSYDSVVYCSVCGHEISRQTVSVPATGHSYNEDGVCTVCGVFKFYATNVNLGNNLDMMFAFSKALADEKGAIKVEFQHNGNTTPIDLTDEHVQKIGETDYYVVRYGFAAKEMCDEVTVTVYNSEGKTVSESRTDSIRDYAMRMLEKDSTSDALRTVIVDMLNYGAACQVQFAYNANDLANSGLDDDKKEYVQVAGQDITLKPNATSISIAARNLIVESNIQFAIAFDGVSNGTANVSFTGHKGNSESYNLTVTDGCIYITGLVVADYESEITVTINDTVMKTSVNDYLKTLSTDENTAFSAFKEFASSSYTYLHNKNS